MTIFKGVMMKLNYFFYFWKTENCLNLAQIERFPIFEIDIDHDPCQLKSYIIPHFKATLKYIHMKQLVFKNDSKL